MALETLASNPSTASFHREHKGGAEREGILTQGHRGSPELSSPVLLTSGPLTRGEGQQAGMSLGNTEPRTTPAMFVL